MSYSDITAFNENLIVLKQANLTDPQKQAIIDQADLIIESDLTPVISVTDLRALSPVPDEVNLLSQYKTCDLALTKRFGANRGNTEENTDVSRWNKLYDILLHRILNGMVVIQWGIQDRAEIDYPLDNEELEIMEIYDELEVDTDDEDD